MKKRILLFAVSLILVLGFTACGKAKQSAEELIQQENQLTEDVLRQQTILLIPGV